MSWDFVFGWVTAVIIMHGIRSWWRARRDAYDRGQW